MRNSHWDGDCIGVGTCAVSMDAPRQVEAVFVQPCPPRVLLDGGGSFFSDPSGIGCGPKRMALFDAGARVELTAPPDPGWVVAAWNGASRELGPKCTLVLDAGCEATVRFELMADPVFRDRFE